MLLRVRSAFASTSPYAKSVSWNSFSLETVVRSLSLSSLRLSLTGFYPSGISPLENLPAKTFIPLSKSYRFFVVSSVFRLNRVGWLCHTAHWQIFAVLDYCFRLNLYTSLSKSYRFFVAPSGLRLFGFARFRSTSPYAKSAKKKELFRVPLKSVRFPRVLVKVVSKVSMNIKSFF